MIFSNALKLATYTWHGVTFIIIAEKSAAFVYIFDLEENLSHVETIDVEDPTSIEFWYLSTDVFMAITQENENAVIWKWNGQQFNFIQNIETNNARKVISFSIDDEKFLAIANHKNNKGKYFDQLVFLLQSFYITGETDIFSEIYKYDKEQGMFLSYQQILTHAAVDIKYFCFRQNHLREVFLIVANSYEKGRILRWN